MTNHSGFAAGRDIGDGSDRSDNSTMSQKVDLFRFTITCEQILDQFSYFFTVKFRKGLQRKV